MARSQGKRADTHGEGQCTATEYPSTLAKHQVTQITERGHATLAKHQVRLRLCIRNVLRSGYTRTHKLQYFSEEKVPEQCITLNHKVDPTHKQQDFSVTKAGFHADPYFEFGKIGYYGKWIVLHVLEQQQTVRSPFLGWANTTLNSRTYLARMPFGGGQSRREYVSFGAGRQRHRGASREEGT